LIKFQDLTNASSFRVIWGIPLGGKRALTSFSNFRIFFENKKTLELKIMIFENSSPKGILWQNMSNVPKWSMSQDSQCSQAGALKSH